MTELQRIPGAFNITDPDWPVYDLWRPVTSDGFSGADAPSIVGRSTDCELGGQPLIWTGTADVLAITGGQAVKGSSASASWSVLVPIEPADVEATIQVTKRPTGAGLLYLDIRRQAAGSPPNSYRVGITANSVYLQKRVGGASIMLIPATATADGDFLGARAVGSEISLLRNGVVVGTVTDTDVPAAGAVGLASPQATTGYALDNFRVRTPA